MDLEPFDRKVRVPLWLVGILALLTAGLIAFGCVVPITVNRGIGLAILLALALGLLVLAVLSRALHWERSHPFLSVLRHRRDEIVWVYLLENTAGKKPHTQLFAALADGTIVPLSVGTHQTGEHRQLLALLAKLAPQATVGHSADNARRYFLEPASLRNT